MEFSSDEWISTDAFADTMEVGEDKPRTISIWFKPYLQSHWGSAPDHHSWDPIVLDGYYGWPLWNCP